MLALGLASRDGSHLRRHLPSKWLCEYPQQSFGHWKSICSSPNPYPFLRQKFRHLVIPAPFRNPIAAVPREVDVLPEENIMANRLVLVVRDMEQNRAQSSTMGLGCSKFLPIITV